MRLMEFWEFLQMFVRNPGDRGIWHFSGIPSISNLSVFSADGGFDSNYLPVRILAI